MNAGGVPNTCKSSGKVLHLVFDASKSVAKQILLAVISSRLEVIVEC